MQGGVGDAHLPMKRILIDEPGSLDASMMINRTFGCLPLYAWYLLPVYCTLGILVPIIKHWPVLGPDLAHSVW